MQRNNATMATKTITFQIKLVYMTTELFFSFSSQINLLLISIFFEGTTTSMTIWGKNRWNLFSGKLWAHAIVLLCTQDWIFIQFYALFHIHISHHWNVCLSKDKIELLTLIGVLHNKNVSIGSKMPMVLRCVSVWVGFIL